MSRADESAMPTPHVANGNGDVQFGAPGLTIREHFSALAMQGRCASVQDAGNYSFDEVAAQAVSHADALIDQLAKPSEPNPDVGADIERYLTERIEWLEREISNGGDAVYLVVKLEETNNILENVRAIRERS